MNSNIWFQVDTNTNEIAPNTYEFDMYWVSNTGYSIIPRIIAYIEEYILNH